MRIDKAKGGGYSAVIRTLDSHQKARVFLRHIHGEAVEDIICDVKKRGIFTEAAPAAEPTQKPAETPLAPQENSDPVLNDAPKRDIMETEEAPVPKPEKGATTNEKPTEPGATNPPAVSGPTDGGTPSDVESEVVKALAASGELYEILVETGNSVADQQVELMRQGMSEDMAWEIVKEQIFLPPEK